ncbi:MAG TPA: hypothetical protein VG323_06925 [Thermoanaerobaculia bacterium]|nr:hypothetical protein [Thermoanaerobaculia bacterium]
MSKTRLGEPPPEPPPRRVDHFLCYDVTGVPQVKESIALTDQFGNTTTLWLQPVLFGVPVDKNGEGILHPEVHLAIYEISERRTPEPPIIVNTRDQFGPFGIAIRESFWLAVPSLKEWKPSES